MIRLAPLVAALLALSGCTNNEAPDEPVGAVTQSEAEALDEAAEMIEARRLPEGLLPAPAGDETGAPTSPGTPSLPKPQESGGPEKMELPR